MPLPSPSSDSSLFVEKVISEDRRGRELVGSIGMEQCGASYLDPHTVEQRRTSYKRNKKEVEEEQVA
jgi:hypothetical protein